MKQLKKYWQMFKRSKTLIFAFLLSILGTVQMSLGIFTPYMSPERFGIFSFVVGIVVTILRFVTKTSLNDKVDDAVTLDVMKEALANSEKKEA